jgi:hypothetical protein
VRRVHPRPVGEPPSGPLREISRTPSCPAVGRRRRWMGDGGRAWMLRAGQDRTSWTTSSRSGFGSACGRSGGSGRNRGSGRIRVPAGCHRANHRGPVPSTGSRTSDSGPGRTRLDEEGSPGRIRRARVPGTNRARRHPSRGDRSGRHLTRASRRRCALRTLRGVVFQSGRDRCLAGEVERGRGCRAVADADPPSEREMPPEVATRAEGQGTE